MKVGVTGHQNIPAAGLSYIRQGMEEALTQTRDGLLGVSSLAVGADQLFASLVLERGGRLHLIIPCRNYDTTFTVEDDLKNYKDLLSKAHQVTTLPFPQPSEDAYLAAGHRIVDECDLLVAVWDGKPARGKGGTADAVSYAHRRGKTVRVIWPHGMQR
jgi:hypothetical protein